jgi:hypothetical protein
MDGNTASQSPAHHSKAPIASASDTRTTSYPVLLWSTDHRGCEALAKKSTAQSSDWMQTARSIKRVHVCVCRKVSLFILEDTERQGSYVAQRACSSATIRPAGVQASRLARLARDLAHEVSRPRRKTHTTTCEDAVHEDWGPLGPLLAAVGCWGEDASLLTER